MNNILRPADAAKYLGLSKSTLYAYVQKGLLEKPLNIGGRMRGWRTSTLDNYLASLNAASDGGHHE